MKLYSLIFSNNNNYRFARHSIFWITWIAYYTTYNINSFGKSHPFQNRFLESLIEITLSTPMDMIFCYSIIYFLLPKFLFKGRYVSMILLWFLFSTIFIVLFETFVATVVPPLRDWFALPKPLGRSNYYWVFFSLFSQINMEGCMAAAIKLGKLSFIKQKEIDLLKNEMSRLQTQTDKVDMQPGFLIDIINRVEHISVERPDVAAGLITKVRNLMVHFIYENTRPKVNLKKELDLINQYIELEQNTREDAIKVNFDIAGNIESENIASFILLQYVQNAFKQIAISNVANKVIDIKLKVINSMLDMMVSWNKPSYTSTLNDGKNIILQNLNKRLNLIYPQSHEMKILINLENVTQLLKINLKSAIN